MTGKTSNIRRAFDFLLEHAQERKSFSVEEFSTETEWSIPETRERIVDRLSDLIYQEGEGFFAKPGRVVDGHIINFYSYPGVKRDINVARNINGPTCNFFSKPIPRPS